MSEELQNQGLQQDGDSPEPSQDIEGDHPVPSQEGTDQLQGQELNDPIPGQDSRGVSAENVLSEVLRKINNLNEKFNTLESRQTQSYQQPYQNPHFQNQQVQPQMQPKISIPKTSEEAARIIDVEVREKYGKAMLEPGFDPLEMLTYREKRTFELNEMMANERFKSFQASNSIQAERYNSENRIKNLYPDLIDPQSKLAQATLNELNRRAYSMGMSGQELYNKDPYILESIAPMAANQLGIAVKAKNPPKIVPMKNSLPPSGFEGKHTPSNKEGKPTEEDILFAQRFNIKPESLAKARKDNGSEDDPTMFVDKSGKLYS